MLAIIRRAVTAEGRRQRQLETLVRQWLSEQLLPPAPGRPRDLTFNGQEERTCHVTPCFVTATDGTGYVDLDVRDNRDGRVIMTIRTTAGRGEYVKTLWR